MLNNYQFQRYITTIAKGSGLSVQWTDEKVPRTNGKIIMMPRGTSADGDEEWKERLYYAIHEAGGHCVYTDMDMVQEKQLDPTKSQLGFIWNVLEDMRVDYLDSKEYAGDRDVSDEIQVRTAQNIIDRLKTKKEVNEKQQEFLDNGLPLMEFNAAVNKDMFPSWNRVEGEMKKFLGTKGQSALEKLMSGNFSDEMRKARTIEDKTEGSGATYKLARRIFEEVFEQDADEEEKRAKEEAKKDGKGNKEKEKADKGTPDKGEAEGEGEKGEGKAEQQPRQDIEYSDMSAHSAIGESGGINYTGERKPTNGPSYTPPTPDQYCTVDYTTSTTTGSTTSDPTFHECARLAHNTSRRNEGVVIKCSEANPNFSSMVRQRLQIRSRSRWEYAKKQGKMHRPSLHKVVIKDAPGYNERIFKKKVVADTLDTAITILGDFSGSMGGSKIECAAVAMTMLNESIGNVLHIPLELLGFTEWGPVPVNFIFRTHAMKQLGNEILVPQLATAATLMSNNADGDNILWAYHRLLQQKQKRKLLIVLSDGSPAYSGTRGSIIRWTKNVVSEIEAQKRVEVYGIGIEDHSVQYYYKEHAVINKAADLESTLLTLIDKKLS